MYYQLKSEEAAADTSGNLSSKRDSAGQVVMDAVYPETNSHWKRWIICSGGLQTDDHGGRAEYFRYKAAEKQRTRTNGRALRIRSHFKSAKDPTYFPTLHFLRVPEIETQGLGCFI